MGTNSNKNANFALLKSTLSLQYQKLHQIKTDITGGLKLIAKGRPTIILSISSLPRFPLTASSRLSPLAVKSAYSLERQSLPQEFGACELTLLNNLIHLCLPSTALGALINQ